jgi:hypothetical protein
MTPDRRWLLISKDLVHEGVSNQVAEVLHLFRMGAQKDGTKIGMLMLQRDCVSSPPHWLVAPMVNYHKKFVYSLENLRSSKEVGNGSPGGPRLYISLFLGFSVRILDKCILILSAKKKVE